MTIDFPAQPKKSRREEDESRSRRVVQTTQGRKTEKAAPDAYLGERTQTFDRQTVSKTEKIQSGKQAAAKPQPKSDVRGDEGKKALSKLGLAMLPAAGSKLPHDRPDWRSSDDFAPQDFVKGMPSGDKTALNTKEYVFYGYFQRIRERLDLAWTASLRSQLGRIWRNGRQLASDMDHTTRVLVTLNGGGEIVRVQVVEESGTRDLDDAAVKAFNQAGPFPNPPKGIVDASGFIQIRWDFVLKT